MSYSNVCGDVASGTWRVIAANTQRISRGRIANGDSNVKERKMASRNGQNESGTTTERFASKAHDTVDSIAERAQRAEREVREAAARTAEQARILQEEAQERAERTLRRAGSYVESNPLAVAGIAFVAGVLLSALLRR